MKLAETISSSAVKFNKSLRTNEIKVGTSGLAGKSVPIIAQGVLREERMRGNVTLNFSLAEMADMPMNAIQLNVYAYFVPKMAFERFKDMGRINRSYMGENEADGNAIPWVTTVTRTSYYGSAAIEHALGLHPVLNQPHSVEYREAYNTIWNYRAAARSKHITQRAEGDWELAPAFWRHTGGNAKIVADFDQAMLDGEVPLTLVNPQMPVRGIGVSTTYADAAGFSETATVRQPGVSPDETWTDALRFDTARFFSKPDANFAPDIFAEMQADGIQVSLANIEMAKQTAAFAKMRKKYKDWPEEHLIDLLMQGIRVPEEALARPMLLDRATTIFGYDQRYATDGANLRKSVTEGITSVDLSWATPELNTGGVFMVIAEIVPEQMFERQVDPFVMATQVSDFPNALRDLQDPEHVDIVLNKEIDSDHADPDGVFGYQPGNSKWNTSAPRLGGKFYRPNSAATFDEDRQRFWNSEVQDPALTTDWYLTTGIETEVFSDANADHFEVFARGMNTMVGNTVFGAGLVEGSDDYDKVKEGVDTGRIDQTA